LTDRTSKIQVGLQVLAMRCKLARESLLSSSRKSQKVSVVCNNWPMLYIVFKSVIDVSLMCKLKMVNFKALVI